MSVALNCRREVLVSVEGCCVEAIAFGGVYLRNRYGCKKLGCQCRCRKHEGHKCTHVFIFQRLYVTQELCDLLQVSFHAFNL